MTHSPDVRELAGSLSEAEKQAFSCGVVHGEMSWASDVRGRISVNQYQPESFGDPERITVGIFLGEHRWAMAEFSPRQAAIIIKLMASKPAVRAYLEIE